MDELANGELTRFEKWFIERQREKGNPNPTGLISVEKAILVTYILFLSTKESAP